MSSGKNLTGFLTHGSAVVCHLTASCGQVPTSFAAYDDPCTRAVFNDGSFLMVSKKHETKPQNLLAGKEVNIGKYSSALLAVDES